MFRVAENTQTQNVYLKISDQMNFGYFFKIEN